MKYIIILASTILMSVFSSLSLAKVDLREDAINCNVLAFSQYMTDVTVERVTSFDEQRNELNILSESIFNRAKNIFGDNAKRTKKGVVIFFKKHHDHEFSKLFGPSYLKNRREFPNEPPRFEFNLYMGWDVECKVIQFYQACLESSKYCKEINPDGSEFKVNQKEDDWVLVHNRSKEVYEKQLRNNKMILTVAKWLNDYLGSYDQEIPIEKYELELVTNYIQKMMVEYRKITEGDW